MTTAVSSTTSATTTAGTSSSNALNGTKDEFLKLFMAQLQNQNPLEPQDGAQMVSQLAQFSSVEQATQTNQHLADLASAQAATSSASLSNLVGRNCDAAADSITLDTKGAIPPLQLAADAPMTGGSVIITDASGKQVRKLAIPDGATTATLQWDGKTDAGTTAASGDYTISVDPGKSSATVTSQWHGRVDGIELTASGTRVRMGGVLVTPADVRTIGLEAGSTPTSSSP